MGILRTEITVESLNRQGEEYLPGYLGVETTALAQGTLSSRMAAGAPVTAAERKAHADAVDDAVRQVKKDAKKFAANKR